MRSVAVLTPLAALVLGVAGCGDDDEPRAASVRTTTTTVATDDGDGCAGAEPAPPSAVDGSPAEVVASAGGLHLAIVDRGASVDVVSLYRTIDCAYEPLLLDGAPAALAVGGSVTHGDGVQCGEGTVTVLSATSDDGETYQATAVTYEVDGVDLIEVDRQASTIEASESPELLGAYYRLDC